MNQNIKTRPAGFFRRIAAIFYDSVLLFPLLFITSAPLVVLYEQRTGQPLYDQPAYYLLIAWLYALAFFYYGWFWTRSGQTPGMKAWGIKIRTRENSHSVNWFSALKRYLGAIISWLVLGLGFLWTLIRADKSSWHDLISGTRLFRDSEPSSKEALLREKASSKEAVRK